MKIRLVLGILAILGADAACAADAQLNAAFKTFAAISGDPTRLKTYCDLDAAQAAGKTEKVNSLVNALGPDFAAAWVLRKQFSESSIEGISLRAAQGALDAKCVSLSLSVGDDKSD